jgi:ribonuclease VapC
MVIDTSALIAIAFGEPSRQALLDTIELAINRIISSVSLLEAGIVLRARLGESSLAMLYELIGELAGEIVPFDEIQARLAVTAFGYFGKGMGHKAQLNFGECAVYALAKLRGEPVLATGGDFAATDLTVVRP